MSNTTSQRVCRTFFYDIQNETDSEPFHRIVFPISDYEKEFHGNHSRFFQQVMREGISNRSKCFAVSIVQNKKYNPFSSDFHNYNAIDEKKVYHIFISALSRSCIGITVKLPSSYCNFIKEDAAWERIKPIFLKASNEEIICMQKEAKHLVKRRTKRS